MAIRTHYSDTKTEMQKKLIEKQVFNLERRIDYDTHEFTVELLVAKFRYPLGKEENQVQENNIYIPSYHRPLVWSEEVQSKFIESVILGIPTPFMFMAERGKRLEVVDGTQRIHTLSRFFNNELMLSGLQIISSLNGFKFEELPFSQQRRFKNRTIRIIVFSKKADEAIRRNIFERINVGAYSLSQGSSFQPSL